MYLIANIGFSTVNLTDLGVELRPKQAIDLHKIETLIKPEKSIHLRVAIEKKLIKELVKTEENKPTEVKVENTINQIDEDSIVEKMRILIKEEIEKSTLSNKKDDSSDKLDKLISMLQGKNLSPGVVENKEEDSISSEQMMEIHSRAMKKITKDTQGDITYSKEEVSSDSVNDKINKLENLI